MSALRLHQPEPTDPPESPQSALQAGAPTLSTSHVARINTPENTTSDSTKSWLDVLEKLLPMPDAERKAIRDELASHLRERVRDLTISGVSEHEAVRMAIAELGDAAELAKGYRNVKSGWPMWARSHAMKIAATSVVVAGLVVGGIALRGSGQEGTNPTPVRIAMVDPSGRVTLLESQDEQKPGESAQTGNKITFTDGEGNTYEANVQYKFSPTEPRVALPERLDGISTRSALALPEEVQRDIKAQIAAQLEQNGEHIRVSCGPDMSWGGFFEGVAKGTGKKLVTHTMLLAEGLSIQLTDPVGVEFAEMSLKDAIRTLNEHKAAEGGPRLVAHITAETIEFATDQYFDKRDQDTRTYSLDALVSEHMKKSAHAEGGASNITRLAAEEQVFENLARVMMDLVEPNMWKENGGELASVRRYGSKLFIVAPKRHFERIEWMLKEVGAFEGKIDGDAQQDGARAPAQDIGDAFAASPFAPASITNRYVLTHAKAAIVRDALGQLFNAAPSLKECDVPRVMSVDDSQNLVDLTATADQIDIVNKVVAIIDRKHPKDYGRTEVVRHVTLSNTSADGMVEVIGRVLNAVPSLVECNVSRSIYADSRQNTMTIVSTGDQGAIIAEIIEGIDKAVGKQVASSVGR